MGELFKTGGTWGIVNGELAGPSNFWRREKLGLLRILGGGWQGLDCFAARALVLPVAGLATSETHTPVGLVLSSIGRFDALKGLEEGKLVGS